MSLVKFNHRPRINSLFDDFFPHSEMLDTDYNKSTIPAVNVKESESNYSIDLAIPGMKKEDLNIELDNDKLIISSETETKNEEDKENYTRREFFYSKFQRTFNLPKNIDKKNIVGDYKDGILTISIPKLKEGSLSKKITIK